MRSIPTGTFGDDWEHGIVVEKKLAPEPGRDYPVCIAGEQHGPPEDCGGVGGFHDLLDAIGDPGNKERDELLEWLGEDFDPEAFSLDEVNGRLAYLQRRGRKSASRAAT